MLCIQLYRLMLCIQIYRLFFSHHTFTIHLTKTHTIYSNFTHLNNYSHFSSDYAVIMHDDQGFAIDVGTQLPVHHSPLGHLTNLDGHAYPDSQQLPVTAVPEPSSAGDIQRMLSTTREARRALGYEMEAVFEKFCKNHKRGRVPRKYRNIDLRSQPGPAPGTITPGISSSGGLGGGSSSAAATTRSGFGANVHTINSRSTSNNNSRNNNTSNRSGGGRTRSSNILYHDDYDLHVDSDDSDEEDWMRNDEAFEAQSSDIHTFERNSGRAPARQRAATDASNNGNGNGSGNARRNGERTTRIHTLGDSTSATTNRNTNANRSSNRNTSNSNGNNNSSSHNTRRSGRSNRRSISYNDAFDDDEPVQSGGECVRHHKDALAIIAFFRNKDGAGSLHSRFRFAVSCLRSA
jgi:hypothetical protein